MAKGKGKAADAPKTTPVKPSDTLVLIAPATLRAMLKQDDNYKGQIDSLTGELREAIGNAKEKKHLDTKAYALLKRFHREKSNEKLANLWHTLLAYMDMAGVMKRIDSVQALNLDGESREEEEGEGEQEAEAGETGGGTVARPQFGGARTH